MAFLTIFTAPKPFTDSHVNIIQRNAVQAWTRLPDVDVILIGDEPGIPEAANEFGVRNFPLVKRNEKGIPLVNSVMEIGHAGSDSPFLCYANADMILMTDLIRAARQVSVQVKDFLLVGQRWNLDLNEPFDFNLDWETRLRNEVVRRGRLNTPWAIDYFIFPHHLYTDVPDFTIGRIGWDNWMIHHARTTFGMAVDATADVMAVHQNHDYSHIPEKKLMGTEVARSNIAKAGGRKCIYTTLDTNREVIRGRLRKPQFRLVRLLRRLEWALFSDKEKGWKWELGVRLRRLQRELGSRPRRIGYARRS